MRALITGVACLCVMQLGGDQIATAADKSQTWIEVKSPHFVVVTNSNAKQGRRIADQFEQERAVFRTLFPHARVDPGLQFRILAVKDEKALRELLPGYWAKKGQVHPAGLFVTGQDKYSVAMRLDVEGPRPYVVLYHEYVHLLVSLNFERIPLWVNEGLADFYGNMEIGDKEVSLGNFSLGHLEQLRENKLLPLEVLLTADEHSPYYNEENKASVFYAEAWALVHYLLLGDNRAHTKQLSEYLALVVDKHITPMEAAHQVFGDLGQLSKKLSSYASQESFAYLKMKSPAQFEEKDFPTRELPAAEALAIRGDFYAHTERPDEARNLLQQALALDPKLSDVCETFGLMALNGGKIAEASENFQRAVELDSHSFLAYYFAGMVAIQQNRTGPALDQAEGRLQRAIELNPEFAAAYSALAQVYVLRGDKLDTALDLARMAAKLEPGDFGHKLNIGYVLLRLQRTAEAKTLGDRLLTASRTDSERLMTQSYLVQVQTLATYEQQSREAQQAPGQSSATPDLLGSEHAVLVRRPPPSATAPTGPRLDASGKITSVSCDQYSLDLTLTAAKGNLTLHTDNYYKLEFQAVGWEPPPNFNPCHDLEGNDARVGYVATGGAKGSGILLTVEVRGPGKK